MRVKRGEQSSLDFEKDRTVLSPPFHNQQKSVLWKQKSLIQDDMKIAQISSSVQN